MNKKITTLFFVCFALLSTASAQYNLFNSNDVDADGWLWFDTQEKIDKYISTTNNEDGIYDPAGKIIQLMDAPMSNNYAESEVSPEFIGIGSDRIEGGINAKIGGIKLAPASGLMSANGSGIIVKMPSCTSFNVFFSSTDQIRPYLRASVDANTIFEDYTVIQTYIFTPLAQSGQYQWNNIEKITNTAEGINPSKLQSSIPIYIQIYNGRNEDLYIHGIKALTSTPGSGIDGEQANSPLKFDGKTISCNEPADIQVYSTTGNMIASEYTSSMNVNGLAKGIYIVKAEQGTMKIAIR